MLSLWYGAKASMRQAGCKKRTPVSLNVSLTSFAFSKCIERVTVVGVIIFGLILREEKFWGGVVAEREIQKKKKRERERERERLILREEKILGWRSSRKRDTEEEEEEEEERERERERVILREEIFWGRVVAEREIRKKMKKKRDRERERERIAKKRTKKRRHLC